MYKKIQSDMHFKEREEAIQKLWEDMDLQHKLEEANMGKEIFTIYDGPPTANGKPHIGHVLTRSIKDLFPRYRRMKGQQVEFKAGWDTHGLPVELEVEKLLGIDGKDEIEAYGVESFVHQCKESVWKYKDEWEQISNRLAYSADMENPYITYENNYIESVWWSLKKIWDKGLLYNGFKVVPYCPRCGTALSSHEVAQGYKDVVDTSTYVRFKVKDKDQFLAVWTTTPWTLPSNVALCVNPSAEYVLLSLNDEAKEVAQKGSLPAFETGTQYYIARELADQVFGENHYTILDSFLGEDLKGLEYEAIFPYSAHTLAKANKKAHYLVADDYVTLSDGTGIVHIAPAFGEDDARIGRVNDLPFVQLVNTDGTMSEDVTDVQGQFVKDADLGLMAKLEATDRMLFREKYEHSYPHCWRCDTPLIYYARNTWFIEMTKLRERLMANNQKVNWIPENVKDGRFGNFIENVVDWGLSRERYWGTPLPIWQCSCGHEHCIGSIEELKSMSDNCPDNIELHKPFIDQVPISCPECGGHMKRVKEVIDGWYDSGAMPFAQYHYPFENKEKFEANFPSNFISEAQDQTRGWFYSTMAIATLLFDQNPYENVIVMGLVQDKDGRKMSKHIGNVVDPWDILNNQGADAIRWYFYHNSQPWLPSRFSAEAVSEGQRKFMGTLWNTLAFLTLYANIDQFDPTAYTLDYEKLGVMDRWMLAKLTELIKRVDKGLENYEVTATSRAIQEFTDDVSNWYVRRSRERFWASGMEQDKINAYMTLHTTLVELAKLAAPFVPFISEQVYQVLARETGYSTVESVHLCTFPEPVEAWEDEKLIQDMGKLIDLVQLGRAARNTSGMKNRQPLARAIVVSEKELPEDLSQVLKEELNIDEITYTKTAEDLVSYHFKPQLRTLGKKLGAKLPAVRKALEELDGNQAWKSLQETGHVSLDIDGDVITLEQEDLLIETGDAEGYATMKDNYHTIALDLKLDDNLISRGFVREIISKVQNMRKASDFEVTDRITLYYAGTKRLNDVILAHEEEIGNEVLANRLVEEKHLEATKWDINGEACFLYVERS